MSPKPPNKPGTMPATNSCVTDDSDITAYKIIGIDGGIMMANDAEDDVTAAANGALYPFFFISGIKTEPSAATSATADPEISAKNKDTPMLTCAKPPRIQPNSAEAKLIKRREIPDEFMMAPAKMNKVNPEAFLAWVLERIQDHPANRMGDLMPWAYQDMIDAAARNAEAESEA